MNFYLVVVALVFLSKIISVDGSETIDCSSGSKPCVSLCCTWGQARWAGSCVADNETAGMSSQEVKFFDTSGNRISQEDYNVVENDPCLISWMASSVVQRFNVDEKGSIRAPDFDGGLPSGFDEYCLLRYPRSTEYLAKICRPWVLKGYFEISCVVLGIIAMSTVVVVYTVVPELVNLHGLMIRCYAATYIGIYVGALVGSAVHHRIEDLVVQFLR